MTGRGFLDLQRCHADTLQQTPIPNTHTEHLLKEHAHEARSEIFAENVARLATNLNVHGAGRDCFAVCRAPAMLSHRVEPCECSTSSATSICWILFLERLPQAS